MMIRSKKYFWSIAFLMILCIPLLAQDTLTPLYYNPYLQSKKGANAATQKIMVTGGDTIELPFYEDFSTSGPYPDQNKWMNSKSVYVNNHYGRNPRSIGVATFDGLKSTGYPYKPYGSSSVENSDTLTSKYIRLDSITGSSIAIQPNDSVYLSFYYQPRGYGHYPSTSHTLILDFYNPTTQTWVTKMTISRSGSGAYQVKDTTFTRVMIPITDPDYFKQNFRFRFRNKSSGVGAVNHWNIDNIYLNYDRGATDTTGRDLCHVYPARTLLETYTAMPYEQYTGASQMATHSYLTIRNNYTAPENFTGYMEVRDNNNTVVVYDTTGSDNAPPFYPNGYVSNPDIIDPINSTVSSDLSNFAFNNGNPLSDSITYRVKHYFLSSPADINKANDTAVYEQKFMNYFSYDDGSAELAYGLQDPNFFGAETAVKYTMANADTLQAIDIFFNPVPSPGLTVAAQANLVFGLRIWGDGGGIPGGLLYDDNNSMNRNPQYYSWGPTNSFMRCYLHYPLIMSSGTFYVGVKQDGTPSLNIGFDQNTNNQYKNFYNVGSWTNASFKGTLMIRPVFGDSIWAATGIKNPAIKKSYSILYPNPANDKLFINSPEGTVGTGSIEIMDAIGKICFSSNIHQSTEMVDVANFDQGIYFVRIYNNHSLLEVKKLIIAH